MFDEVFIALDEDYKIKDYNQHFTSGNRLAHNLTKHMDKKYKNEDLVDKKMNKMYPDKKYHKSRYGNKYTTKDERTEKERKQAKEIGTKIKDYYRNKNREQDALASKY